MDGKLKEGCCIQMYLIGSIIMQKWEKKRDLTRKEVLIWGTASKSK